MGMPSGRPHNDDSPVEMPTPSASRKLGSAIATTNALVDQFSASLCETSNDSTRKPSATTNITDHPSPLPLLSASAASLKAQVTKLSLLTITPPLTHSAITSVLTACNDSVLPSLVSAALLISDDEFTKAYAAEARSLTRATLRDVKTLVTCVTTREKEYSKKTPSSETPGEKDKAAVTEATGRVWEGCDELEKLAKGGIGGFVVAKAQEWLALMQDAVAELKEWDPEEEDEVDFLVQDSDADSDEQEEGDSEAKKKAASQTHQTALKVLTRIPQSIYVVIKQRLQKGFPTHQSASSSSLSTSSSSSSSSSCCCCWPKQRETVDRVLAKMRSISDCIDQTAEALYMGDHHLCLSKVVEARTSTIEVVDAVLRPWDHDHDPATVVAPAPTPPGAGQAAETKEDKYVQRALEWIRHVEVDGPGLGGKGGVVK